MSRVISSVIACWLAGWLLSPPTGRVAARVVRRLRQRRRRAEFIDAIPDFCQAVARRLMVGDTVVMALAGAGADTPLQPMVERVQREHAQGVSLSRAMSRWAARDGSVEARLVSSAVGIASGPVGASPELFDQVALSLRRREAVLLDGRAQASQATLSIWVVVALPWFLALVLLVQGGGPARIMVHDPVGRWSVLVAVLLDLTGLFWMRHEVHRAAR